MLGIKSVCEDELQPQIAVIIPFFQRKPGILARALASVEAQTAIEVGRLQVIVVDDGSPVPAAHEAEEAGQRLQISVLQRGNGGPGAARNLALDHVQPETQYVAFLDSDDVWEPDHLSTAIGTLEASAATFFFGNFFQLGAREPAFQRGGRLDLKEHLRVFGDDGYAYHGDMAVQILTGNVIGTPTVVYRYDRHPRLRFRPEYRRAGEDYLMWLDFVEDGATFAFRWSPSVTCKEGVNVYSGVKWGSIDLLERTREEVRYLSVAIKEYTLPEALKSSVNARVSEKRWEYWRAFPAAFKRRPLATMRHLLNR